MTDMAQVLSRAGCFVAIIGLGILLRRIGVFKKEDFGVLSRVVLRITLPAAIISSSAGKAVDISMLSIAALGLGGGVLYMALAWVQHRKASRERLAFEVLNLPGFNIGAFSLPFVQGFLGPAGVVTASLFDMGNAFVCLGGAYGVAAAIQEGGRLRWKPVLKALSCSVPFLAHLLMVTLNLLGLNLPAMVVDCAGLIGNANAAMAMLMIGVGFHLEANREQLGRAFRILAVRYSVAAAMAAAFYFLLPFDLEVRQALVILTFSPIGSAVPGFTADLGGDVGLSSAVNSISIVCSVVIIVTLLTVML